MKYWHALNLIDGIGQQKLKILAGHFENGQQTWQADFKKLTAAGLSENLANKIIAERAKINPDQEWAKLQTEKISVVSLLDENYPPLLREIPSAPFLFYAQGNLDLLQMPMVSLVGSRKFTDYGRRVAQNFGRDLAQAGLVVVSGLAIGIDALSHQGALEGQGKTLAVLGNGLLPQNIHPRANFQLSREILRSGGLLVSEFTPETSPAPGNFPSRNRIIAGLSLGTVVVEAAPDSGSLITAGLALEFNREVFAVPGAIFNSQSQGCHQLIKNGAKLVASINDILEEFDFQNSVQNKTIQDFSPDSPEEEKIFQILSLEPLHVDTIVKLSKLKTETALSTLSILEIKGAIKNIGGQNYVRQ